MDLVALSYCIGIFVTFFVFLVLGARSLSPSCGSEWVLVVMGSTISAMIFPVALFLILVDR